MLAFAAHENEGASRVVFGCLEQWRLGWLELVESSATSVRDLPWAVTLDEEAQRAGWLDALVT